ncbi:MAG: CopG family transcriptional regulator [Candidatus Planktophila sp.]
MTLRLSDKQSKALRKVAESQGISMQEAALAAVDEYTSKRQRRLNEIIERIRVEDAELLKRLSQ